MTLSAELKTVTFVKKKIHKYIIFLIAFCLVTDTDCSNHDCDWNLIHLYVMKMRSLFSLRLPYLAACLHKASSVRPGQKSPSPPFLFAFLTPSPIPFLFVLPPLCYMIKILSYTQKRHSSKFYLNYYSILFTPLYLLKFLMYPWWP